MICLNTNISVRNNQAFSKESLQILYWFKGSLSGYNDPKGLFTNKRYTKNRKKILLCILKYIGCFSMVYISQQTIARLTGVHHDTVLRAINLFVELGVLKKKYRGANRTCLYSLGSLMYQPQFMFGIRYSLKNAYWAMKSSVARAKGMLSGLTGGLTANFRVNTARLSKDKTKDINTMKNINYLLQKKQKEIQEVVDPLSPEDILKYEHHMTLEKKEKERKQKEFAAMLGF